MFSPPQKNRLLSLVPVLLLLLLLLAACGGQSEIVTTTVVSANAGGSESAVTVVTSNATDSSSPAPQSGEGGKGLNYTVSAGMPASEAYSRPPVAPAEALDPEQTQLLLARLPGLDLQGGDVQDFRFPEETLPAPRPGQTVEQSFPPQENGAGPDGVESGPLSVLRFSPEGDVPLAPFLSVTFDQPMVAVTGQGDLAALDSPVTLSPLPEGEWIWVGTKTLTFEPTTRFPMATTYQATIPVGTLSATGGQLAQAVTWTFTTPAPQVTNSYPNGGPTVRDPLIFVAFDQQIDPQAVFKTITVRASGADVAVTLADDEMVAKNESVRQLAQTAGAGRWLAFQPTELLPYNTTVSVILGPETPSAEGPNVTRQAQSFSFTTYGPLLVADHGCNWGTDCPPLTPWFVRFSNPLDEAAFDASQIEFDPPLPGARVSVYDNNLSIEGRSAGRTTYKVTLKAGIQDQFGQVLEKATTLNFRVGSAEPMLTATAENFVLLDPSAKPAFSVFSINYTALDVQVYRVTPQDWPAYLAYLQNVYRDNPPSPPGEKLLDTTLRVDSVADTMVETSADLSPFLTDGKGHLILVIQPQQGIIGSLMGRRPPVVRTWVQISDIALEAAADGETLLVWANSLADGRSLQDVTILVEPGSTEKSTDAAGMASFSIGDLTRSDNPYLVAQLNGDTAILPENTYGYGGQWMDYIEPARIGWYVIDDRQMYRPGEEVHVKGWIRRIDMGKGGDVDRLANYDGGVNYQLFDSRGNQIGDGEVNVSPLGGFDMVFTLPGTMNLGSANLNLTLSGRANAEGADYYHSFQVQEFRRPEFEVSASASEGPHFVGESATFSVKASYFAGGPLAGADTVWNLNATPGSYAPPNWDEFTFGVWQPWWRDFVYEEAFFGGPMWGNNDGSSQSFAGQTDGGGEHTIRVDFASVDPPRPTTVSAEATVMDVNRQAWTASASLLVHPADRYVGIRGDRTFVQKGEPIELDLIVTDLDGQVVAETEINVRAVRLEWTYKNGSWQEVAADEQLCTVLSGNEPVSCSFETLEGGTYEVTATIKDDQGRPNMSQITRWVSGGQQPTANRVEQEAVELIPDRQSYQPGDTVEILVQAPFAPAEGLLTIRRSGMVLTERFQMSESTYTLQVPVTEEYTPNFYVQVDLVGAALRLNSAGELDGSLPTRPAYASGQINLSVPPLARTLELAVTPQDEKVEPGAQTAVDILVTDGAGQPVEGAELAVIVVDESVLALTNYQLLDPLEIFYPMRSMGTRDFHLRQYVLLVDPDRLREMGVAAQEQSVMATRSLAFGAGAPMAAPMAEMAMDMAATEEMSKDGAAATTDPIRLRTNFDALAEFAPEVTTDAAGQATVSFAVPDNLTRYRVMVVAVAGGKQYGKAESAITARLPLMVRPSAPRFLNFGDTFELPIVVQNQTDAEMVVDVAVQASNVTLLQGNGKQVTVPANDRVEVRFPTTTESAGTARFQVGVASGAWSDAASFELPVYTPATSEAFATYGVIDAGAIAQPVIAPTNVFTQFGGLELTTSSTALQALTDAVLYLTAYPYECSEQLASRILGVAALRDVLTAFQADGLPDADSLMAAVNRDIQKLQGMQNWDGGFPIWQRGDESWPFYSIHATHALVRAQQKGFIVPEEMLFQALDYLRNVESHYPSWYSQDVRNTLTAYALNVRKQMGDVDVIRARKLIADNGLDGLSMEAVGWLLGVLADEPNASQEVADIRRFLNNHAVESAGAANFTTSYREEDGYLLLASNRRADGVILDALMTDQPENDLIPKVVAGLLAHRTRGHWGNTQENVFVLLALDKYFNTYEAQTPDFVARAWLGEQYVAGFDFQGRSTDYQSVTIPMAVLANQGSQDLVLSKEGDGRLYYRLGLNYAPTSLDLEPMDRGFTVLRTYEAVDDPADVSQDEVGVWHVKAGARVRVRLTMVAPTRRYHVALADPMPAGFEAMNPALAVTGSIPQDPNDSSRRYWWRSWSWYEHQNLRDQRAEAFTSLLWDGIHRYTYVARATTPGAFVVPPAKAEEMYAPEVFGRSASDKVIIE